MARASGAHGNHHLIRKLAQCRQMYCVIYSCARAGPPACSKRRLAPRYGGTLVGRRAPRAAARCRAAVTPGRAALCGAPARPARARVYQASIRMPTVFSLGTGRTDFFLSSDHRLVSVCILRLCMHPVTSPVTAPAASVARHGTQVPHTHTQPQPHADRRLTHTAPRLVRGGGPGGRGGAGRARGGGPGARPLTSRCCCVS